VRLEHFGASADYERLYREASRRRQSRPPHQTACGTPPAPHAPGGHQRTAAPSTGGTGDRPT
jgi:transketolase